MAAMTNAEKQKAYRERLRSGMTEEGYQEYKKHLAKLDHQRYVRKKLFDRIISQFEKWFTGFKDKYHDEYGRKENMVFGAPLFVPETPFFKEILHTANLDEKERRVWEILFYSLSVFPKVSAGPTTFYPVMAYSYNRSVVDSAIEKLIAAKAIMFQEEDCLGLVTFFRGDAWPWEEEFQASFDLPAHSYIDYYERWHCDEKHPLRRWRGDDHKTK